ncbi:MAG: histidine phosphatase family protein [Azospirillaceae bacterium]|nr:histidine phosphatase family protein [Azospirillaceae bacterium]
MTLRLTLLAHAPTRAQRDAVFPQADEPAEAAGLARMADLADRAPLWRKAARLWTAPETRARQTAAPLSRTLSLEAGIDPVLRDLDAGNWRGQSLSAVGAVDPAGLAAWLTDPTAEPHGGESIARLLQRVGGWMDGLIDAEGHVVAVTHAAPIRAAVLHALGTGADAFWRLDIVPLSLTDLRWNGRWTVRATGVE